MFSKKQIADLSIKISAEPTEVKEAMEESKEAVEDFKDAAIDDLQAVQREIDKSSVQTRSLQDTYSGFAKDLQNENKKNKISFDGVGEAFTKMGAGLGVFLGSLSAGLRYLDSFRVKAEAAERAAVDTIISVRDQIDEIRREPIGQSAPDFGLSDLSSQIRDEGERELELLRAEKRRLDGISRDGLPERRLEAIATQYDRINSRIRANTERTRQALADERERFFQEEKRVQLQLQLEEAQAAGDEALLRQTQRALDQIAVSKRVAGLASLFPELARDAEESARRRFALEDERFAREQAALREAEQRKAEIEERAAAEKQRREEELAQAEVKARLDAIESVKRAEIKAIERREEAMRRQFESFFSDLTATAGTFTSIANAGGGGGGGTREIVL